MYKINGFVQLIPVYWPTYNLINNISTTFSVHQVVKVMSSQITHIPLTHHSTKEDLCIEEQEMGKNFALIIKSFLFEGIFIDAKGVHCASLETAHAKKIFFITISEDLLEHKHHLVSEFMGHHICKQNAIWALN